MEKVILDRLDRMEDTFEKRFESFNDTLNTNNKITFVLQTKFEEHEKFEIKERAKLAEEIKDFTSSINSQILEQNKEITDLRKQVENNASDLQNQKTIKKFLEQILIIFSVIVGTVIGIKQIMK